MELVLKILKLISLHTVAHKIVGNLKFHDKFGFFVRNLNFSFKTRTFSIEIMQKLGVLGGSAHDARERNLEFFK